MVREVFDHVERENQHSDLYNMGTFVDEPKHASDSIECENDIKRPRNQDRWGCAAMVVTVFAILFLAFIFGGVDAVVAVLFVFIFFMMMGLATEAVRTR